MKNYRIQEPSFLRKFASWCYTILHARRYRLIAEDAKAATTLLDQKLADCSSAVHQLSMRLEHLSAEMTGVRRDIGRDMGDLRHELSEMRREVMFQQRRLNRSLEIVANSNGNAISLPEVARALSSSKLDSFYAQFEDHFRGSRSDIKKRVIPYVQQISVAGAGQGERPILDIGCGRGEWLEALRDSGLRAYGIDLSGVMVERARAEGLDARQADLTTHLRSLEDDSLSGITAFHVVEHLPLNVLIDFLDEALRVLAPGGILILETPNCETMRVGATTFYLDPTHHNPIPPPVLEFAVKHRGFEEVRLEFLHPFTEGLLTSPHEDAKILNRMLLGPQDYAVIARRG